MKINYDYMAAKRAGIPITKVGHQAMVESAVAVALCILAGLLLVLIAAIYTILTQIYQF